MLVFHTLAEYEPAADTIATLGTFDGLHLGHVQILKQLLARKAERPQARTLVITFDPHPRSILQPDSVLPQLHTLEEKTEGLELIGVDALLIVPFTLEFSRITSDDFIREILVEKVRVRTLVVGYDHRFGRNRTGGFSDLNAAALRHGFEVEEIPAHQIDDANVSSTKIRSALNLGDVRSAARYLGYRYSMTAEVVPGNHRGRDLGFPTANLHVLDDRKLIPLFGVYAVNAIWQGKNLPAMMNIGYRPTFGDSGLSIEVHLIDFDGDLYGQPLRVEFVDRIRPEKKFSSAQELVEQLHRDREQALAAHRAEFGG